MGLERLNDIDGGLLNTDIYRYREESRELEIIIQYLEKKNRQENYIKLAKFRNVLREWLNKNGYVDLADAKKRLLELGVDAAKIFGLYGQTVPEQNNKADETVLAKVIRNSWRTYNGLRKLNKTDFIQTEADGDGDLSLGNLTSELRRIQQEYDAWFEIKSLLAVANVEVSVIENPSPPMRKKLGLED